MSTPAPPTTSHTNTFTSDDAAVERLRIDLLGKGEGVGKAEFFDRQIASGVLDFLADGDAGVALVKAQPRKSASEQETILPLAVRKMVLAQKVGNVQVMRCTKNAIAGAM